jgi:hypothetical protein
MQTRNHCSGDCELKYPLHAIPLNLAARCLKLKSQGGANA